MTIVYVGIALAADAPWTLVMLVPATLVIQLGVIAREERLLARCVEMGDAPSAYSATGT